MQRRALLLLLVLLLGTCYLANCGPVPATPAANVIAPTYTPQRAPTAAPTARPSRTAATTATPTTTATPSRTPFATSTPAPTLPPPMSVVPGGSLPLALGWRLDANAHLTDARIIHVHGEPLFLVSSLGRTVYALRPDGQIAWELRTDGPVYALTALDDGRAAAGDDAGQVTLITPSGQKVWQTDLGSRVTALGGSWQNGILAGGWDEQLSLLNEDGQILWQSGMDGPLSSITTLPNLAVAATLEGQVRAYDPDGKEVWRFDASAPVISIEAADWGRESRVLLSLQNGHLIALDTEGKLRWQQELGTGSPIVHTASLEQHAVPEIMAGTGGQDPHLALLSAEGQVKWRLAVPSAVSALASLDLDGNGELEILTGLADGQILAYDRQGRLRNSVQAGLPIWELLTSGDGSALVLADVSAWELTASAGPKGRPWLSIPELAPAPPAALPASAQQTGDEVTLVFLGDIAPGRSMEGQLARYGPGYPWAGLEPLLQGADLAAANLECVLAIQGSPLDKSYLIRAHPRWGETLVEGGLDLVSLANNHALDFGPSGLDETLSTLQDLGVAAIGVTQAGEAAPQPALFTLNGVRIAVLGYAAARWNGSSDVPATDRLAWAEPGTVQADIHEVRDRVDLVVVLLHAGTEYAANPSPDQIAVAHAAIDAGADLVVGHHSHVTQTVERYKQGLIVYGLGDALFDIPRSVTRRGELLRVHATQKGLSRVELWPFWIDDAIQPRLLDNGKGSPTVRVIYP